MNLLGGAYDDSDSDSEPTPKPTPAPAAAPAASSSGPAPKRKNKRKVIDLSRLPTKRRPVLDDDAGAKQEEDLGKAPLRQQALAAKRNALAQQAAQLAEDDSVLGALPKPGADSARASSSTEVPTIKSSNNPMLTKKKEKKEMITSLVFKEDVSDDEEQNDGNFFTLETNELVEEESAEPEEDNVDAAGPVMPSDWNAEEMEAKYQQPDNFAGLDKNVLLSHEEKRALAMGSNIKEINPTQLLDNEWRTKQLAAELPGRPRYEKRQIKTKHYSVEDQGRVTSDVTTNQKRKHQIGWLAQSYADASYDLAQKEIDGAGKKRATHQKYGW